MLNIKIITFRGKILSNIQKNDRYQFLSYGATPAKTAVTCDAPKKKHFVKFENRFWPYRDFNSARKDDHFGGNHAKNDPKTDHM